MIDWTKANVLVTGCDGFVGSWLVKELLRLKTNVYGFVKEDTSLTSMFYREEFDKKLCLVSGALTDPDLLLRTFNDNNIDLVFHLAAQSRPDLAMNDPLTTLETNIRGAWMVCEACRKSVKTKKIVLASSINSYGDSGGQAYNEGMPLQGRYPYDLSKSCADLIALGYAKTYGIKTGLVRLSNIFGGGDMNFERLIPGTIASFLAEKAPVIKSDGSIIKNYIYVEDAVKAYLLVAQNIDDFLEGEAFNFAYQESFSVLDIVERIQKLMGKGSFKVQIRNNKRAEINKQIISSEKARTVLKWEPSFELEEGLRRTIHWYRTAGSGER